MKSKKSSCLVVHANSLTEARYALTVGEQRLILAILSTIEADTQDLEMYAMSVTDLARLIGMEPKNAYRELDKITDRLMKRVLRIPQANGVLLKTHWVSSVKLKQGRIELFFADEMKPYLLQLKQHFTHYQLSAVVQFKSIYTIRIYQLLKRWHYLGEFEYSLSELRSILGIADDQYQAFKRFRVRVLNQAKQELESQTQGGYRSDLSFEFESIRKGRCIERLRFVIRPQVQAESATASAPAELDTEVDAKIVQTLVHYGIGLNCARKFLQDKGKAVIEAALAVYQQRLAEGQVSDTGGGYLAALIRAEAQMGSPHQVEVEQQVAEQRAEADKAQQQARTQAAQKQQARQSEQQRVQAILDRLSEREYAALIQRFEACDAFQTQIVGVAKEMYQKRGVVSGPVQGVFRQFVLDSVSGLDEA